MGSGGSPMSRPTVRGDVPSFNDNAGAPAVPTTTIVTAGSKPTGASIYADRLAAVSKSWKHENKIECPLCLPLIERQTSGYHRKPLSIRELQLFEGPGDIWVDCWNLPYIKYTKKRRHSIGSVDRPPRTPIRPPKRRRFYRYWRFGGFRA